jgi:hypothetical protein
LRISAARFLQRGKTGTLGVTMEWRGAYLRGFNFVVHRVFAVACVVIGSVVSLSWVPSLLDPNGSISVNGVAESGLFYRLLAVLIPAAVAAFGVVLYRLRPWYPRGGKGDT